MSYRGTSSSASSSPSPISESHSLTTSPTSHPSVMSGPEGADPSMYNPKRSPSIRSGRPDIVRSQSLGGGCWTCRVRRKKCDEQREGDSCATCRRLRINCLGWGPRRPEWLKDKEAVKRYKEEIKAQLARQGMIRGIPRTVASTPSTPSGLSQSHHLDSQPFDSLTHTGGLVAAGDYYYQYEELHGGQTTDYSYALGVERDLSSLGIYEDPASTSMVTPPSALSLPWTPQRDTRGYSMYQLQGEAPGTSAAAYAVSSANQVESEHILYYFQHVHRLQYFFSDSRLTDALHAVIVEQPNGAITQAVCALASLHYANARVAQGLESDVANLEATQAMQFYTQAYYELATSKHNHGQYRLTDAVAALYLASFSFFSKTATDWGPMLEIACGWLGQSDIFLAENPRAALMNMEYLGQFAAKATIWMDVFSSITLSQPPRYLSLYRRLFGNARAGIGGLSPERGGSLMESLAGCPDEVLLAIAEISALAHWKAQELRHGSLSIRELVRRGDSIEHNWLQRSRVALAPDLAQPRAGSSRVPSPLAVTSFPSTSFSMNLASYAQDLHDLVAELFRETATLYLHITLNGCNPGIPEILESVHSIIQILQHIPSSDIDRSIIFPLFLTACVSDGPNREIFRARFAAQDAGCLRSATRLRLLLETIWKQHDTGRGVVTFDWRDTIQELGLNLLLA
ncbi:hypothetical protein NEOLEDRAFT_491030 [Neolentinus lepideus HHB14362 ss-1]|uniref:Zn(2)-C6 fungal-type domain-containing protein n=1 Tax=Neolentinus lepideus HHB14362 ss-1 TaxID=1314782 RepID=A0A165VP71_9AGAM|nr:hypothetical protein NEOLEDRAFT_491030 [Neolentinus lepideus HHB14362 ss-1]